MQGFLELNDDAIRHVLRHVPDAPTFFALATCSERLWGLATFEAHGLWRSFYASRFHLSEFELDLTFPDMYVLSLMAFSERLGYKFMASVFRFGEELTLNAH